MLMHCLEWWLYEIAGFLAGIISEVELAAQSILYELAVIAFVVTPFHCLFLDSLTYRTQCMLMKYYYGYQLGLDPENYNVTLYSDYCFHSSLIVSNGLLRCRKCSSGKCSWCWEHRASQAVQQGLPHLYTYESNTVVVQWLQFEITVCYRSDRSVNSPAKRFLQPCALLSNHLLAL